MTPVLSTESIITLRPCSQMFFAMYVLPHLATITVFIRKNACTKTSIYLHTDQDGIGNWLAVYEKTERSLPQNVWCCLSVLCPQTRGLPCCESGVTQLNQWNYSGFSPTQGHAAFGSGYSAAHRNLTHTVYWHRSLSSFLTVLLGKISLNKLVHDFTSVTPEKLLFGAPQEM